MNDDGGVQGAALLCHGLELLHLTAGEKAEREGVLYVPADIGDFIGNFDYAPLPCGGLILADAVELLKVDELLPRPDAVLVDFAAVGNYAVAHGVGEV